MTDPGHRPAEAPNAAIPPSGPRAPVPSLTAFLAGLVAGLAEAGRPAPDPADPATAAALSRVRSMLGRALAREPHPPVGERVLLRTARLALSPGPTRDHPALRSLLASLPDRPVAGDAGTAWVAEAVDAYLGRAPAVTPEPSRHATARPPSRRPFAALWGMVLTLGTLGTGMARRARRIR